MLTERDMPRDRILVNEENCNECKHWQEENGIGKHRPDHEGYICSRGPRSVRRVSGLSVTA